MTIKIISWNVNGLRAILRKGNLQKLIKNENPDIICLNEVKLNVPYEDGIFNDYEYKYWNFPKSKRGYSGTAILSKIKPLKEEFSPFDDEGRLIHLTFSKFNLINVYTPNSKPDLSRLKYRTTVWDKKLRDYIKTLKKPVILTCDMNTAHTPLDIHNPEGSKKRAGWTDEERQSFSKTIEEDNLIDTFRDKHPNEKKYSYWDYRSRARDRNKGWRIDYFLVSKRFNKYVKKSDILDNYFGSDHAPIIMELDI